MKYTNIVFMQGEDANETLNILEELGEEATYNHLQQWNYGDAPIEENNSKYFTPWGESDTLYEVKRNGLHYVMSYNTRIGYIGLTEIM